MNATVPNQFVSVFRIVSVAVLMSAVCLCRDISAEDVGNSNTNEKSTESYVPERNGIASGNLVPLDRQFEAYTDNSLQYGTSRTEDSTATVAGKATADEPILQPPPWWPPGPIMLTYPKYDLLVRTVNTHRSAPDYSVRLKGIAQAFHQDWPSQIGLIGLQEVAGHMVRSDVHSPNGSEFLASQLTAIFDIPAIGKYSEGNQVGLIVGDEWDILSTRHWELGFFQKRYLIETFLQHKQHGYRLRFYSAHLSDTTAEKRKGQAEKLIQHVLERARPKELPPIVVGDFNAGRNWVEGTAERSVRLMEEHFWRPFDAFVHEDGRTGEEIGWTGIDIIYVGKKSSFPRSRHKFTPVELHNVAMDGLAGSVCGYPYFSDELTDHDAKGFAFNIDHSRYEITIETGDVDDGGTDAQVYVTLYGSSANSSEYLLQDYDKYTSSGQLVSCFEKGDVDCFEIDSDDIGDVEKIRIRHDDSGHKPEWFVNEIRLRNCISGEVLVFPCNTWLASDRGDRQIEKVFYPAESLISYTITVKTGKRGGAGTDANIELRMGSQYESSGVINLPEERFPNIYLPDLPIENILFEKGYIDEFDIHLPYMGDIQFAYIYHDNSNSDPDWFLDDIRVRNDKTGEEWFFPCHDWLGQNKGYGIIDTWLRPSISPIRYCVSVQTGDIDLAGTDANVYITFFGPEVDSPGPEELLDNPNMDDFERRSVDYFDVATMDVGNLQAIQIRHDNTNDYPGWFLDEIRIRNTVTGTRWYFPCYKWLASDEGDGEISRLLNSSIAPTRYSILVKTGTIDRAGTDANVYITLYGSEGDSQEVLLDNPNVDDFEKGNVNYFSMTIADIGAMQRIRIRHDDPGMGWGPAWFLDEIIVQNCEEYEEWYFPCYGWLGGGHGPIERTLELSQRN